MMRYEHFNKHVDIGVQSLDAILSAPSQFHSWVIFAHGSGSSRLSPRNQKVAEYLNQKGFGTLLFDLLSQEEANDRANIFDISLLSQRLYTATNWLREQENHDPKPIAYFGASTGVAAALGASVFPGNPIYSVVSRGGRPDLAYSVLDQVRVPVLLIVGGFDHEVIELNKIAMKKLARAELEIIPEASHLFEERGKLEQVSELTGNWLEKHLIESTGEEIVRAYDF